MLANDLPHLLLPTYIDLPPGDGDPLGRWGDRRADRIGEAWEIGRYHDR
jgi:hypothetical protein